MHPRPDDINEELRTIAPALVTLSGENLYTVPFLYFQQFPLAILKRVHAASSSNAALQVNPFAVPAGYFEQLPQAIMGQVKASETSTTVLATELETIAPLLNTISKNMVYAVPAGYFDNLSVVPRDRQVQATKPVFIVKAMHRYAAAAVTIGILVIGAIFYTYNSKTPTSASPSTIANINIELEKVSDTEIATYLKNNDFAVEGNNASFAPTDELPIQEFIKSLSEEEIKQYLKENGTSNKEI